MLSGDLWKPSTKLVHCFLCSMLSAPKENGLRVRPNTLTGSGNNAVKYPFNCDIYSLYVLAIDQDVIKACLLNLPVAFK